LINFEQKKDIKMSFQNRKQKIIKIIEEKGEVSVKDLATLVATSEITIRRDLIALAKDGLIYRTHGGALRIDLAKSPIDFVNKSAQNVEKKDFICRIAAQEINDGDIIFMDCGSTVFRLCQFIKNKSIRVITNSLPVIYELTGTSVCLTMVGGEIDTQRQAVHGTTALEHIKRYNADKAFLGVDGISTKGLSAKSEREAEITLAMMQQAQTTYLLCDSSKINKDQYLYFAELSTINFLITDADDTNLKNYTELHVKVLNCLKK
jgi:DeoR family transcriptional regulator, fructose operon transcriptional repressor